MYIWLSFLAIVLFLLFIFGRAKTKRSKSIIEFLLISITVYFAAFRDGMGEDYTRYVYRTQFLNNGEELINDLITNIVYLTPLSPIFYFLITSILIYPIILKLFLKQKYYFYIIMSFFFSTGLGYYQSFNIIRQYVAVAFFFLASQYIVDRRKMAFFSLVLVASLFHYSALFLIPLFFFFDRKYSRTILTIIIVISLIGAPLLRPILSSLISYTQYSDYVLITRSYSVLFIILSILMLFVVSFNKDHTPQKNIIINGGVLCVSFFNLSVSSIAFSRFSIYFIPFLFIALFEIINITKRKIMGVLIMSFFMMFFIGYINNADNADNIVLPKKILPINSIYDSVYDTLSITLH